MDMDRSEVTLFFNTDKYRNADGQEVTRYRINRLARVKSVGDGEVAYATVNLSIVEAGRATFQGDNSTAFFLERNDVYNQNDGHVFNEIVAEGDI